MKAGNSWTVKIVIGQELGENEFVYVTRLFSPKLFILDYLKL